jgi:hypothetical protein|tara:strand:+ start:21386 stop:21889 length:504 start_codon:yes stop_codon:yes gene_type:complete
MKNISFVIGISLLIFSCNGGEKKVKEGEIVSALVDGEQTDAEIRAEIERIEKEELERIEYEKLNKTTMSFDKIEHDYGDVLPDSDNKTVFIVTNTGDKPLIIEDVMASCGCTTPEKPQKPIPPGKSDKISVNFHPKPEQKNEIRKTVTVTANTEPKVATLNIRAFVK